MILRTLQKKPAARKRSNCPANPKRNRRNHKQHISPSEYIFLLPICTTRMLPAPADFTSPFLKYREICCSYQPLPDPLHSSTLQPFPLHASIEPIHPAFGHCTMPPLTVCVRPAKAFLSAPTVSATSAALACRCICRCNWSHMHSRSVSLKAFFRNSLSFLRQWTLHRFP